MSHTATIKDRLRDERGFALPDVIVSAIVSLVSLSIIATAVFTFTSLQMRYASAAGVATAAATLDTEWRQDLRDASFIAAVSDTNLVITLERDRNCLEIGWQIEQTAESASIAITTRACDTDDPGEVLRYPLNPEAVNQFSYANVGGRALAIENGVRDLAAGTKPATVDENVWESTAIGAIALDVTILSDLGSEATIHATQQTSGVSRLTGTTDSPNEFVEG